MRAVSYTPVSLRTPAVATGVALAGRLDQLTNGDFGKNGVAAVILFEPPAGAACAQNYSVILLTLPKIVAT